jgi:fibronectin-binding autotransporter adhesin
LGLPAAAYGSCSDVLSLSPATQTQLPGGSATVTATLTCGGTPVSGQSVSFSVHTGPEHGMTSSGTTDSAGQASFTVSNGTNGGGVDVANAKTISPYTGLGVFSGNISIYWESATLSVTSSNALPGQAVSFTGTGYAAGETVSLYANSASGQPFTTVTADSSGSISGTFTVPTAQMNSVGAVGATSGNQGWAEFSQPCTDTWIDPDDGSWNTPADWSADLVPQDVEGPICITEPGNYGVTLTTGASVTSLIVGAPSGTTTQILDVQGNSSLPSGADIGISSTSTVNKTGALLLDSAGDYSSSLGSGETLSGVPNALVVKGLFETAPGLGGDRSISAGLTISGGRVRIGAASTTDTAGIDNNGTLSVDAGDNLDLDNPAGVASYTQGSAGRLNVVVNATTDKAYGLVGSGEISLNGSLGVTTYGTPSASQSFTVISGTSVTGTFSSVSSSVSYTPAYSSTTVVLTP